MGNHAFRRESLHPEEVFTHGPIYSELHSGFVPIQVPLRVARLPAARRRTLEELGLAVLASESLVSVHLVPSRSPSDSSRAHRGEARKRDHILSVA